jgi:hypothetical protein
MAITGIYLILTGTAVDSRPVLSHLHLDISSEKQNHSMKCRNTLRGTDFSGTSQYSDYSVGWMTKDFGFNSQEGQEIFSSPMCPDHFWGPPNLVCSGDTGTYI